MYHGVTARHDPLTNFDGKHVEITRFAKQLSYLKNKYAFISMEHLLAYLEGTKELPDNPLLFTFDDGYKNVYTTLYPLIKREKIPTTVFLPTMYIQEKRSVQRKQDQAWCDLVAWYDVVAWCIASTPEKKIKNYLLRNEREKIAAIVELKRISASYKSLEREKFLKELRKEAKVEKIPLTDDISFLSWEQCEEMQRNGVYFGSHSVTHENLATLDEQELQKEVTLSKRAIEKKLKKKCKVIAYPFGDVSQKVIEATKEAHYNLGISTIYGTNIQNENRYTWKRIAVSNTYDLPIFMLNLWVNFSRLHYKVVQCYSTFKKLTTTSNP